MTIQIHWMKYSWSVFRLMIIFAAFLLPVSAVSDDKPCCFTRFENGSVNWSSGQIRTIGRAAPKDERDLAVESIPGSARAHANRQIIELLQQIRIDHSLNVGQYASKNDIILAGLEKTARDAVVLKQYYTSAMAVELHVETSMYGGFLQLVLPEEIRQIPKISRQNVSREDPARPDGYSDGYTGLIIDARGLGVKPVLNPVIFSEQGHKAYSPEYISREFAVQNGVCKYFCSLDFAKKERRVGARPLVFKGLRLEGKLNDAIVISMSDYQRLEKVIERHVFLAECRVIIVID